MLLRAYILLPGQRPRQTPASRLRLGNAQESRKRVRWIIEDDRLDTVGAHYDAGERVGDLIRWSSQRAAAQDPLQAGTVAAWAREGDKSRLTVIILSVRRELGQECIARRANNSIIHAPHSWNSGEIDFSVPIGEEDILAAVTALRDVTGHAGENGSRDPGHHRSLAGEKLVTKGLRPL